MLKDGLGIITDLGILKDLDVNPNFFKVLLDVSELQEGEYTYIINEIDTGILAIGSLEPQITEFETDNTVIQYGE